MKLVVLGPTQSGKTCLAVGLSCTSYGKTLFRSAFVSKSEGDTSRNQLEQFRELLEGGQWPKGTTDTNTLDFKFQSVGKTAEFSFNDYKGEDTTDSAFLMKLEELGEEDGVVLLVNPGFNFRYVEEPDGSHRFPTEAEAADREIAAALKTASIFDDFPLARKWRVREEGVYEQLIDKINTRNGTAKSGKPVVAVAVTASDRLRRNGDLQSIRPQFESFLSGITTKLKTAGFVCKVFYVSITGALADQSKPRLATGRDNTSPKPFLWVINQLNARTQPPKPIGKWIIRLAIVLTLALGANAFRQANNAEKKIADSKSKCIDALGQEPFTLKDLEKVSAQMKWLRERKGFHAQKALAAAEGYEKTVWEKQKKLIDEEIGAIRDSNGKRGSTTDIEKVEKIFSAFTPSSPGISEKYHVKKQAWDSASQELGVKYDIYTRFKKYEEPLRKCENEHGILVMDKLYPIADMFLADYPATGRHDQGVSNLAARIDIRIVNEWQEFAIPDIEKTALTNATREVARARKRRIDDWSPVSPTGDVAKVRLVDYVSTNIPLWRMTYETNRLQRSVCEPMRRLGTQHGEKVLEELSKLQSAFADVDMADALPELTNHIDKLRINFDNRFEEEWEERIKDFGRMAANNATDGAVRELRANLSSWQPLSNSGRVLYTNKLKTVDDMKSSWRMAYETNQFVSCVNEALKGVDLKSLAAFHPDNIQANQYVSRSFIEGIWNQKVKERFDEACATFVSQFVPREATGRSRPELTDQAIERLKVKAREVGKPLSEDTLLKQAQAAVSEKVKLWEQGKRNRCREWWNDNKNLKDRFGDTGLWKHYERATEGMYAPLKDVPKEIFDEEVRALVYKKVEAWFEDDVRFFMGQMYPNKGLSVWYDKVNFQSRFKGLEERFDQFRTLCDVVNKDKNAPDSSWAKRFARLCLQKEKGGGNVQDGNLMTAFPMEFEVSAVEGWIDYDGRFPTGYKHTSFAFGLIFSSAEEKDVGWQQKQTPEWLVPLDKDDDAPKDGPHVKQEKVWTSLFLNQGNPKTFHVAFFWQLGSVYRVTDYNHINRITVTSSPFAEPIIPEGPTLKAFNVEQSFHLPSRLRTRVSKHGMESDPKVRIRISFKPKSIASPANLLEQAKGK